MKHILFLFILICLTNALCAQYVYTIKADSVKLTNCDSTELIIENHTQGVPGFLYNKGNGRTEFRHALVVLNDSLYLFGKDTLNINKALKSLPPQLNPDWNASSGPTQILNKPSLPTLATVLTQGNLAIAGTAVKPPIVMQRGVLNTTTQPGAVEYDGHALFITDSLGMRHDLTQTDRVFKIYALDYNNGNPNNHTYTLIGWNIDYNTDLTNAHSLVSTIDIEITLPTGTPAGTVVTVQLQGVVVYTLTVQSAISINNRYAIGTIKVNQDLKYPTIFYIKGATETISSTGLIGSTNTATQLTSSVLNPTLSFSVSGTALVRVGSTYTIDKKQQGRYLYN